MSLLHTGEFGAAAEALEQPARLQPRDAAVWNNLGVARGRLGRYDAALAAFRKAGAELSAQNNLGYVHYLNGDYDGALEVYEAALHARASPSSACPCCATRASRSRRRVARPRVRVPRLHPPERAAPTRPASAPSRV